MQNNSLASLLFLGEDVPCGTYDRIYSAHREVVNFFCEDALISLCACTIAPGPRRVVLSLSRVDSFSSMQVGRENIWLSDGQILATAGLLYSCKSFSEDASPEILSANLQAAYAHFVAHCNPACVLAQVNSVQPGILDFNGVLAQGYTAGIELFKQGKYSAGVACFKRKGIGLTPAGDDFMIGMLLCLSWLERKGKKELSKILHLLKDESLGNDPLVNTFIRQACTLRLNDDWANFLLSLAEADGGFLPWLESLLRHGESSGADELSGFFVACAIYAKLIEIQI